MKRTILAASAALLMVSAGVWSPDTGAAAAQSGRRPAGTQFSGKAFRFNEVKPGIYHAVGTGALTVVGNASVIVNDQDVVVVDDHISPGAAWVLLDEVKALTKKPVRTVVNTHFHYDHAHGNQIFGPEVDIIGHEFTRQMLLGVSTQMPLFKNYLAGLPRGVSDLERRVEAATDAKEKAALQVQLRAARNNVAAQAELRPTPPNVTMRHEMTLFRGSREIQIRFLGRGHTAGDVVVYLPKERVVITGDFLTAALSNMSDSYPDEWVASLEALKQLDFDTVLPGHGDAFTDKAKIEKFQAYLRDVWSEVGRLKSEGVSAEEASKRADLTRHKGNFPNIQGPGVPLIGVQRIYELLDAGANRR